VFFNWGSAEPKAIQGFFRTASAQ